MVELQILNKVIKQQSLNILTQNNLDNDYFISYPDEYKYIIDHYNKYGNVPDPETMADKFPEFEFLDVAESDKYLVEKIQEEHLYSKLVPILNKVAKLVQTDTNQAIEYLLPKIQELATMQTGFNEGYDLVRNALDRLQSYKERQDCKGLLGISSGLDDLDEVTHGWLAGEDLITIVGRTNEGKTWVLLYFLCMAWLAGKRVLLYSGEMSALMIGFRFDTLAKHFSNLSLLTGGKDLGSLTPEDYSNWLHELSEKTVPFIVVTPKDLGGKRMTVPMLNGLIEKYKPDIIGIDQFSLMNDARAEKGDPTRIKLAHISEDLYHTSEKYGKPIIADAQANRKAGEKKKGETEADTPELDEIQEADAIGQNSSRVISIKQSAAGLKITVKKNRYGLNNKDFLYFWDIDKGYFKKINMLPAHSEQSAQEASDGGEFVANGTDVF